MGKFQVIGEEAVQTEQAKPQPLSPQERNEKQEALQLLMLSLRVVGQRFVIALSNLFTAAALLSAWFLWKSILPNPTVNQLVGASLYSGFILAVEFVRRK